MGKLQLCSSALLTLWFPHTLSNSIISGVKYHHPPTWQHLFAHLSPESTSSLGPRVSGSLPPNLIPFHQDGLGHCLPCSCGSQKPTHSSPFSKPHSPHRLPSLIPPIQTATALRQVLLFISLASRLASPSAISPAVQLPHFGQRDLSFFFFF